MLGSHDDEQADSFGAAGDLIAMETGCILSLGVEDCVAELKHKLQIPESIMMRDWT